MTEYDQEQLDEGVGKALSIATLVSMLWIPSGFAASKTNIEDLIRKEKTYQGVNDALSHDAILKYGSYDELQALNIIARTLFAEANNLGLIGRKVIAASIWNRAGGDPNKLVDVCFNSIHYSCWNGLTKELKSSSGFEINLPKLVKNNSKDSVLIWNECKTIAANMLLKKFVPISKKINSYYNPDPKLVPVPPKWDKEMIDVVVYGNHKCGYLPENDGYKPKIYTTSEYVNKLFETNLTGYNQYHKRNKFCHKFLKPETIAKVTKLKEASADKIYVVKAGDTLASIAKANNTTWKKLQTLNNIARPDKISIGQKIRLA